MRSEEVWRAVVAHHSMLVIDILGIGEFDVGKAPEKLEETSAVEILGGKPTTPSR